MSNNSELVFPTRHLHRVYLHKLDIDESGKPIVLERAVDIYLLYYLLIFDQVILQSSSFFKRKDLFDHLTRHPDLFRKPQEILAGQPMISHYRGIGEESNKHYLEKRLEALRKQSSYNAESAMYKENHAVNIARELDSEFAPAYIPHATQSTDALFRNLVSCMSKDNFIELADTNIEAIVAFLHKYALGADVFQTFILEERAGKIGHLTLEGESILGHQIRKAYYQANADANNCMSFKSHYVKFKNVERYLILTGLIHVTGLSNVWDSQAIECLKRKPCYRTLQEFYFMLSEQKIDHLYQLYRNHTDGGPKFYKRDDFRAFCFRYGFDYQLYKKAFNQLHKWIENARKNGIYE